MTKLALTSLTHQKMMSTKLGSRAAAAQQANSADQANPSRQGQRTDLLYNTKNDIQEVAPAGTSRAAALRRLRKDRRRPLGLCQRLVNY